MGRAAGQVERHHQFVASAKKWKNIDKPKPADVGQQD
jgi:hypothetical protein